jgi:hypothetical protein
MLADGFPGEFLRYLKKKWLILLQASQQVRNPPKRVLACWSKTISPSIWMFVVFRRTYKIKAFLVLHVNL